MLVSPVQTNNYSRSPTDLRSAPFPALQHPTNYSAATSDLPSTSAPNGSTTSQTTYRAPAHKHAHHLHSIPPREKSTRTLIIDHMLWVHGRTRFAQARAELGMTDRTGGSSSHNYIHRQRPENHEEDEEEGSDGEDVAKLKAISGDPDQPPGNDEELRLQAQDLSLARELRLRAEGLEKVVSSMLDQPPPLPPHIDEDVWTPPTSPSMQSFTFKDPASPHRLPNGVRLRLALCTMINDLFARQAPPPPYRHQHKHAKSDTLFTQSSGPLSILSPGLSSSQSSGQSSGQSSKGSISYTSNTILPPTLASLSTISAVHSVAPPAYSTGPSSYPGYALQSGRTRMHQPSPTPSSRTHLLYMAGADPSTANSPPSLRCPRHLHTGCEICVEAKTARPVPGVSGRNRPSSSGAGNLWRGMPGGVAPGGGGISGWQDGSGIGSGLLRPGVNGSALRRKGVNERDLTEDGASSNGAGNTKLSELIPRFIKLSALVAAELGTEARDEEDESSSTSKEDGTDRYAGESGNWEQQSQQENRGEYTPLPDPTSPSTRTAPQLQERMYEYALRPTREWYMLLAGLLTRAVLEGYLTAGWRGPHAVECLLTVGMGMAENAETEPEPRSGYEPLYPDDLPGLLEAIKVLFPSWRTAAPARKGMAEEEYEMEMHQRLIRFYDIPASTPDLSTHMEDLAWQYPAEPVERAAVRFCEAIARWRGKPELETYKRKPSQSSGYGDTPGSALPIESLVHSSPLSATSTRRVRRKPSIDVYFVEPPEPPLFREDAWNGKRVRSPGDGRASAGKRARVR